jgi:uncharacterized protein YjbI with pentapeptide repeats
MSRSGSPEEESEEFGSGETARGDLEFAGAEPDHRGPKLLAWTLVGIGFTAAASAVGLGIFVRLIDGQGSWWKISEHHLHQGDWFEAARVTVALVALTVGGGAAYLAYRRQRTADQNQNTAAKTQRITARTYQLSLHQRDDDRRREMRDRFSDAAAQLANSSAAVRIAGVYAMTALANDWHARGQLNEVQTCIDVLAGYLRLPYDPEHGASHLAKLVITSPGPSEGRRASKGSLLRRLHLACEDTTTDGRVSVEKHYAYRQQDREVRQTIVRTIAAHVRKGAVPSWANLRYDFRNAIFEGANFDGAEFNGGADFNGSSFFEECSFEKAIFQEGNFSGARFLGRANFRRSTFLAAANFSASRFEGDSALDQIHFSAKADFAEARFDGKWTTICGTTFDGDADFENATFIGDANITAGTVFNETASFIGAHFCSEAGFGEAAINVGAAKFVSGTVTFRKTVRFWGAEFEKNARFIGANFQGEALFNMMTVHSRRTYDSGPTFRGPAYFNDVIFGGGGSFAGADFGNDFVSFENPSGWLEPPKFDWDEDESRKPGNVKPDEWISMRPSN